MPRHIVPLREIARCGSIVTVGPSNEATSLSARDNGRRVSPRLRASLEENGATHSVESFGLQLPKDFSGGAQNDGELLNIAFDPCVTAFRAHSFLPASVTQGIVWLS